LGGIGKFNATLFLFSNKIAENSTESVDFSHVLW